LPKPKDPLYQLLAQDADTFGGDAVQQNNALANFIAPTYDIGRAPDDGIITDSFDLANLFKSGAEPAPTVPDFNVRPPIVERDPFNLNSGVVTEEPMDLASLFKSGAEPAPTVPDVIPRAPGNQFVQEAAQEDKPITTAAAQQPKTDYIDALSKQILGQGYTDKWTGAGFGSVEANARDMARILDSIGITDIKQFGLIDKPYDAQVNPDGRGGFVDMQGKPVDPKRVTAQDVSGESGTETVYTAPTTTKVYGNKVTGQEVPMTYSERQTGNAFGGTFQGAGNTGYRVQFDPQGNPIFYTTGASSNNMAQFAPLLAMASLIPGVAPFAQGLNALMAAKSGDVLGAIAGAAGLGGYSDVANAANFAKAAKNGDPLSMLFSGANLGGVSDIGGVNLKDVSNSINAAKALQSGDPVALLRAASGYMGGSGEGPNSDDFIKGYFQPGGEGYVDPDKEEQTVNQNPDASSELIRMLNPYLSEEEPTDRRLPTERPSSITDEEITPDTLPFDTTNIMPSLPQEQLQEILSSPDNDFVPTIPEEDLPEVVMTADRPSRDFDIEEINPDLPTVVPGFDEYNRDFDIEEINPALPTVVPGFNEPEYLKTDDDFVPTTEMEEPESPGTTSKKVTAPKKATKAPAAKAVAAKTQATQEAQNNARLLALLGMMDSNNDVAHIKSYKELFDTDLYEPGKTQEEVQKEAQKEAQNDENISDNEEDFFNGGHVNDITVDDLLQILRS
jgi:hypothetical protein